MLWDSVNAPGTKHGCMFSQELHLLLLPLEHLEKGPMVITERFPAYKLVCWQRGKMLHVIVLSCFLTLSSKYFFCKTLKFSAEKTDMMTPFLSNQFRRFELINPDQPCNTETLNKSPTAKPHLGMARTSGVDWQTCVSPTHNDSLSFYFSVYVEEVPL